MKKIWLSDSRFQLYVSILILCHSELASYEENVKHFSNLPKG